MYCSIDEQPNPTYILAECGKAIKANLTPVQVVDQMMKGFGECIDRDWVLARVKLIQLNWFTMGIVSGIGENFPFDYSRLPR